MNLRTKRHAPKGPWAKDMAAKIFRAAPRAERPMSSCEARFARLLDMAEVEYIREFPVGRFKIDFFLPKFLLAVEVDGGYWHSLPGAKERDARKDELMKARGYVVKRIKSADIKKNLSLEQLVPGL